MSDIFISYKSDDRAWVEKLAIMLEQQGYQVWWDTGLLAGHDFQAVIPARLAEARCVIVVWSERSAESIWVRAEASRALSRKVLIPVLLRDTDIPMPFDIIHTEDFRAWQGDVQSPAFKRLLLAISAHTKPGGQEQVKQTTEQAPAPLAREQEEAALRQEAEKQGLLALEQRKQASKPNTAAVKKQRKAPVGNKVSVPLRAVKAEGRLGKLLGGLGTALMVAIVLAYNARDTISEWWQSERQMPGVALS